MPKRKLETLETEILKAESALSAIDAELIRENPDYKKLKALSKEVLVRAKRIRKAIKRDRRYFT